MLVTATIIFSLLFSLILTKYRAVVLFALAVFALYLFGIIDKASIVANITNDSVLTLISLMIASLALERSQLLSWLSSHVFHPSYGQTIARMGLSAAFSSAILNNTAVVATLMSGVLRNQEHPPSKLLLPLSYFAILGGTLTLIGTSTNLVVNALLVDREMAPIGFFEFAPVGLCLLIVVGVCVLFVSRKLTGASGSNVEAQDYFIDAEVLPHSKLVGNSVLHNRLRALDGLFLVEIVRGDQLITPVTPDTLVEAGDKLIFSGEVSNIRQLTQLDGVEVFAESSQLLTSNLSEVIVSPESVLIGKTLKRADFRSRFDAAVVAISRGGQRISGKLGDQTIQSGDKLVLAVGHDFSKRQNLTRNFFILSGIKVNSPLNGLENFAAIVGFLLAIAVSAFTLLSLLEAIGFYIMAMIGLRVLDGTTIRRRFPFELWLILICALSIAQAFSSSGLANHVTDSLYWILGEQKPYVAFIVVILCTVALTEIITNTAAAAIMLPIAISLANVYDVNSMSFVMAVAYAASACFISPYGYQTNLMVMNAGGYQFSDFIRVGWKVSLVYIAVIIAVVPQVFPF